MHSSALLTERWLIQVFVGEVLLQFHNCFNILYSTVIGEMSLKPGIWAARVRGSCVLTSPQEMLELVLLPVAVVNIWCQLAPGKWWSGSVSSALQENTIFFMHFPQCFWVDSLLKDTAIRFTSVEDTFWRLTVSCHFTNETKAFPALLGSVTLGNLRTLATDILNFTWLPDTQPGFVFQSTQMHVMFRGVKLGAQIPRSNLYHQRCFLWQNSNMAWCVRRTGADFSHWSPVTGKKMMYTNWNAGNSIWMSEPLTLWVGLTLEQVTQGGCGVSILGDSQSLIRHSPGQPVLTDSALNKGEE